MINGGSAMMKKRLFSLLLTACLLCSSIPAVGAASSFRDISDPDTALAAEVLQSMGIVGGVSEGVFSPDTTLTRAQFCVLMVHTLGLKEQTNTYAQKTLFTDVTPGNWYTGYVNLAYSMGLLAGYGNGKFGPDDPVNYGQAATLLLRMLNYTSADVGKVWPLDYVNYAHTLELDKGVCLSANDPVCRGDAAILLYNTLNTEAKGNANAFYKSFQDTAAIKTVIVLDPNADNGTATGLLMACVIDQTGASVEYFPQKNVLSNRLIGCKGDLLLNSSEKVIGFVPGADNTKEILISRAKTSGITDTLGVTHRISGSTVTLVGEDLDTWSATGYIRANKLTGRTARLYYDDDGSVSFVCIFTGSTDANTHTAFAQTENADTELARKLGVRDSFSITKNGFPASAGDLAQYDTAYYDAAGKTLCVSDYRITGYIQAAAPNLEAAESITVAGCTLPVLESAWDTLENYKLGQNVTLLLTDDCSVAAALPSSQVSADMVGVLSPDGKSVTLCGSGLVISSPDLDAEADLRGTLVKTYVYDDSFACFAYRSQAKTGQLNISQRTLGSYALAPACSIYEHSADRYSKGYLYSLDGTQGVPSSDFEDIFWTDTVPADNVALARLNSAGQVDVLVLQNVTGNGYEYGKLTRYTGYEGVMTVSSPKPVYSGALTLTNGSGQSQKHLSAHAFSSYETFHGIALGGHSSGHRQVVSLVELNAVKADRDAFSLQEEDWYASVAGLELPVSDRVQVYIEPTDQWISGTDAVKTVVSSGLALTVHYDRTPAGGGQIRVIAAKTSA